MSSFKDKHIVLGVTGSIAAYKAVELASRLVQAGAQVDVIMTQAAQQFVTPLTFRSITHRPVVTDWFDPSSELSIQHVSLAESADAILVAPATADIIAKISLGLSDDPLTGTLLATRAPLVVAPAMDANMFEHPATQQHVRLLYRRGVTIVGPEQGHLASGLTGLGRLSSSDKILGTLAQVLGKNGPLRGRRVIVTAGPTQEPLDPAWHLSNPSSGKMGYALATAARDLGASVLLISGPTSLDSPVGIETARIHTALDLRDQVLTWVRDADVLLMAAAPADFRAADVSEQKMKKGGKERLTIELVQNPDILAEVQGDFVKVGFAAESESVLENAKAKLAAKALDLIVANDITSPDSGFAVDTNKVTLIDATGSVEELPLLGKDEVAERILERVVQLLKAKEGPAD